MNSDAVAAIAETIGAIGVIATLIYQTTHIRQSTRAAIADFFYRQTEVWIDFNLRVADNQ